MILHCSYDMTETSSVHCFRRCITRCFGLERHSNIKKNAAEPIQNGFTRIGDEHSNGHAGVKVSQPNSNGCNKQITTGSKSVGEKSCCAVLGKGNKDEIPYSYEPVSATKNANGNLTTALDNLSNSSNDLIDTRSNDSLLISKIDQKNVLRSLSNDIDDLISDGLHFKETNIDDIEFTMKGNVGSTLLQEICNVSSSINSLVSQDRDHSSFSSLEKDSDAGFKSDSRCLSNSESCLKTEMHVITKTCQNDSNGILILTNGDGEAVLKKSSLNKSEGNQNKEEISGRSNINTENEKNSGTDLHGNVNHEGEHDVSYFRALVESETAKLNILIQKWEKVLLNQPDIIEEVRDEIRSVNGQTHLVISERFTQFKSLIDQSEQQSLKEIQNTKIITLTDLQGFWDMIYYQVQDVLAKFQRLEKIKENNWNPEILHKNDKKPTNTKRKRNIKKTAGQTNVVSEEEKVRRLAARKRLAEARKKLAEQNRTQNTDKGIFIIQ